ncbi:hypothetical protein [Actibacterium sp. MT2.3-13A]|uniref:hypothetical protein n=1 Tax=Actibacterium sp. MT2.3-13A TaxID=2828332 RepID=UPI001BA511A3|nr:hypothetical protein [Actibacterium sp. MT2.3-13A]
MLNRRMFATGLAALPAVRARASEDRDRGAAPELVGRVRLNLGPAEIRPDALVLLFEPTLTVPLDRAFPMSNERRAGLITPTLRRRFRKGEAAGNLHHSGPRLVAAPVVQFDLGDVFLVNGDISWRINARAQAQAGAAPLPGLSELPVIGRMFRGRSGSKDRDNLLILVTPSILDDDF